MITYRAIQNNSYKDMISHVLEEVFINIITAPDLVKKVNVGVALDQG